MTEYKVTINGGETVTVLADSLTEAVQKAFNYNMIGDCDAVEYLSNIFNDESDKK
jgi:hypothetical protein